MSVERKLLKRALDALEQVTDLIGESGGITGLHRNGDDAPWDELLDGGSYERLTGLYPVIKDIDTELAKPEPEAVNGVVLRGGFPTFVATSSINPTDIKLYPSPPKRVALSDGEIKKIWLNCEVVGLHNFISLSRAIEKAHGIGEE